MKRRTDIRARNQQVSVPNSRNNMNVKFINDINRNDMGSSTYYNGGIDPDEFQELDDEFKYGNKEADMYMLEQEQKFTPPQSNSDNESESGHRSTRIELEKFYNYDFPPTPSASSSDGSEDPSIDPDMLKTMSSDELISYPLNIAG